MTGATMVYTGGTLNIGTAATVTNFNFRAQGQAPNVVIDNTTNNKTLFVTAQLNVWGNLTINPGTTLNVNQAIHLAADRPDDHEQRRDRRRREQRRLGEFRRQPADAGRWLRADLHRQRHVRRPRAAA